MHCPENPASRVPPPLRRRGFTLLELLVAVTIFAIVGLLAIGGLRAVLEADRATQTQSRQLADLQIALAMLEGDLRHAIDLRPRDQYGDRLRAFRYSPVTDPARLEFVRAGLGGEERVGRVAWHLGEAGLTRTTWPTVDGGGQEDERARTFLTHAANGEREGSMQLEFEFVDPETGETADAWPPLNVETPASHPAMVRVFLEVPGLGEIERRIPLQEGVP